MNGIDTRTSFQFVCDMNVAFGNPKGDFHKINGDRLLSQCKNIIKEYEELMLAISEGNIDKIRDALCDIQVFAMGAQHFMGIDGDRDMHSVLSAVMTRFCTTPLQLSETQAYFNVKGVKFYVEGEFPTVCLKSSEDQGYYNGSTKPEYPKGKFLKAVGFSEPVFYQPPKPVTPRSFIGMPVPDLVVVKVPPIVPLFVEALKTPADITDEMASVRVENMMKQDKVRKMIDDAVTEFRGALEKQAYGFEPFDGNKNNTSALG